MKKLVSILTIILFTVSSYAQDKKSIKKATEITNEMTEVLTLNEVEKAKVYEIQLERFEKVKAVREEHKNDKELMQSELKKIQNKLWGKLKGNLGVEKMKAWGKYKRNNY